jgi:nitroimidazol reductase NimA-like FMN-containing flavoprotein (pyridoxamine 5'-phosphate oxidase superfamily)
LRRRDSRAEVTGADRYRGAAQWSEDVQTILAGDHVTMLGYVTPASGVVLAPVTNFGRHDRQRAIVTFNTSVGAGRKIARIQQNPRVALAFHTRAHATHDRPEYVLVQGSATIGPSIDDFPSTVLDDWERFERWSTLSPPWKWWMRVYARRVEVSIAVERIIVWPDLACTGELTVHGAPLPDTAPPSQAPPAKGTGPRGGLALTALAARRLPDVQLGWLGADHYPFIVPVQLAECSARGLTLQQPSNLVPAGCRRAGLTSHWFSRGVVGQCQAIHTGWLEAADELVYAPHTRASYFMPPSRILYRLATGGFTRLRGPLPLH